MLRVSTFTSYNAANSTTQNVRECLPPEEIHHSAPRAGPAVEEIVKICQVPLLLRVCRLKIDMGSFLQLRLIFYADSKNMLRIGVGPLLKKFLPLKPKKSSKNDIWSDFKQSYLGRYWESRESKGYLIFLSSWAIFQWQLENSSCPLLMRNRPFKKSWFPKKSLNGPYLENGWTDFKSDHFFELLGPFYV